LDRCSHSIGKRLRSTSGRFPLDFPPEAIAQLKQLAEWIAKYGDSVYGTRGGPIAPQKWGVTTKKGDKIFSHIKDAEATAGEEISLPELKGKVKRAD
jgi:alpha-L-fucosidase